MATFGEWLFLEQIREEVYETSLRRLQIDEALRRTFEFYNMAVRGQWDLILENSLEDEDDDGPVPDYDPFADGDENANPVEENPDDGEEEVQPKARKKKAPRSENIILQAKTLKRYAQIVRWAAMLDRRDAVAEVAQIYRDELIPLLGRNESLRIESLDDDDDDDWGYIDFSNKKTNAVPAANQQAPAPSPPSLPSEADRMKVIGNLRPLLEKLGYIEKGELDYGTIDEKFEMVARAAEAASKENGNDPPSNEPDVQMLIKNPEARSNYPKLMMEEMEEILRVTARRVFNDLKIMQGTEGGEKKYGVEDEGDVEAIISKGIHDNMRKLQRRIVNKDGVARDWNDDLTILTADVDSEEDAKEIIGNIRSPISNQNRALRDARREKKRTSGQSSGSGAIFTCSDCGHTRSVASRHIGTKMKCPKCQGEGVVQQGSTSVSMDTGATAEDGTPTGTEQADTKTRDSITTAANAETAKEITEAFRESLKELAQADPSKAILACLFLGLHRSPETCASSAAEPSDADINRVISSISLANKSDRAKAVDAFKEMGFNNLLPGGQKTAAQWELVKRIKESNVPATGVFRTMPQGPIPQNWTPKWTGTPKITYPNEYPWYMFINNIVDALTKHTLPPLIRRMYEILAEKQTEINPKGQRSPCSWDLSWFIKSTFAQSIKQNTVVVDGENPIKITIYGVSRGRKKLREYLLSTDGRNISATLITLDGNEMAKRSWPHPQLVPCAKCGGSARGCAECEGCGGKAIDRIDALRLERRIDEFLRTELGTRAARRRT